MADDVLGIILAREGSKRLPGKNNERLGDDRLTDIVISKAKEAGISDIWLCTDDYALRHTEGATLITRPEHLSRDDTPSEAVLNHIFTRFSPEISKFKYICLLQLTAPLFWIGSLKEALFIVHKNNYPGMVSVTPALKPSGNFYIINIELFKTNYESYPEDGLWIPDIHIFHLPWEECVDIDHIYDLRIAQAVYYDEQGESQKLNVDGTRW